MRVDAPSVYHVYESRGLRAYAPSLTDQAPIDYRYPAAPSVVTPSVFIDRPVITGHHRTGMFLERAWNPTINDAFISGPTTQAEVENPQTLQVGIDLFGSMDANINAPRITCANVAIRARSHTDQSIMAGFPRCEGLDLKGGFLMNVNRGIELYGSHLGGWATPSVYLAPRHIAFHQIGIYAQHVAMLTIENVNLHATEFTRQCWGIYLVGCKDVQIKNINFWANWSPFTDQHFGYGCICLIDCENVEIWGGTTTPAFHRHRVLAINSTGVRMHGRVWDG